METLKIDENLRVFVFRSDWSSLADTCKVWMNHLQGLNGELWEELQNMKNDKIKPLLR